MVGLVGIALAVAVTQPAAVAPAGSAPMHAAALDLSPRAEGETLRPELEARRGETAGAVIGEIVGPAPQPDIAGYHDNDAVSVSVHADGRATAKEPRAVRGAAGLCLIGRCITTRGVRTVRERQEAPPVGHSSTPGNQAPTAPRIFGLAFAFGWQPPSPKKAATLLRDTSDRRVVIAIAAHQRALEQARRDIGRRLAAIVHDPRLTAVDKRRIVFELWDDAMSTAAQPVADDDALGVARASAARSIAEAIERFVQRAMPPGSALGYAPEDLARLHARRSGPQRFAPYAENR